MGVIFLFLASSSNTRSFLRKFFSRKKSARFLVSLVLRNIMFLLLNLSLCPESYSLLSLCSSEMMLQNFLYLRSEKFFILQIGDKSDSVSVDRLKAVFSSVPVTPAVPPPQGRPCLQPASVSEPPAHVKRLGSSFLFLLL